MGNRHFTPKAVNEAFKSCKDSKQEVDIIHSYLVKYKNRLTKEMLTESRLVQKSWGHFRDDYSHECCGDELVSLLSHPLFIECVEEGKFWEQLGSIRNLSSDAPRTRLVTAFMDAANPLTVLKNGNYLYWRWVSEHTVKKLLERPDIDHQMVAPNGMDLISYVYKRDGEQITGEIVSQIDKLPFRHIIKNLDLETKPRNKVLNWIAPEMLEDELVELIHKRKKNKLKFATYEVIETLGPNYLIGLYPIFWYVTNDDTIKKVFDNLDPDIATIHNDYSYGHELTQRIPTCGVNGLEWIMRYNVAINYVSEEGISVAHRIDFGSYEQTRNGIVRYVLSHTPQHIYQDTDLATNIVRQVSNSPSYWGGNVFKRDVLMELHQHYPLEKWDCRDYAPQVGEIIFLETRYGDKILEERHPLMASYISTYGYPSPSMIAKSPDKNPQAHIQMWLDAALELRKTINIHKIPSTQTWCQICGHSLPLTIVIPCGCISTRCHTCLSTTGTCECGWPIMRMTIGSTPRSEHLAVEV